MVVSEIEDLRVTVYPAPTEETPEPEAIEPEEDESWLLAAGDYVYSAEAENYISLEKVAFTLTAEASPVYELHPEMTPVTETADAAEKSETAKEDVTGAKAGEADGNHAEEPAAERLRAPADEPVGSAEIVDSGTCDDGLSWTLTADGTLTVSGNGAMRDNMSPRPPWKDFTAKVKHIVIEDGVTKVGQSNFDGLPNLLTVTVADSVTEMSSHCICNCPSLTDVKLPKNLAALKNIIHDCAALESITIPAGVREFDGSIGTNCPLKNIYVEDGNEFFESVDGVVFSKDLKKLVRYPGERAGAYSIPEGTETIGHYAFSGCGGLTAVTFPSSLTEIGLSAFASSGIAEVTIPESVTTMNSNVFASCPKLSKVVLQGNHGLPASFVSRCPALTTIEAASGKVDLSPGSLDHLYALESFTINEHIGRVYERAFDSCTMLKNIVIDEGNGRIHENAFASGTGIEQITVTKKADNLYGSDIKAFANSGGELKDPLFEHAENYFTYSGDDSTLGRMPLTAGDYYVDAQGVVFLLRDDRTASLVYASPDFDAETYAIPETVPSENGESKYSVTEIGDDAFKGCEGLTRITIPGCVAKIGGSAFAHCTRLAKVNGETGLQEVLNAWANEGANVMTFLDTALSGSSQTIVTEPIVNADDTGRQVKLSTEKTTALTGEPVMSRLEIDRGENDSNSVVRVYFQFDDEHGRISYPLGPQSFGGIEVEFCQSAVSNVYYYQVRPLRAGETISLDVSSLYENIVSGGGSALIWPSVMTKEEAESFGNAVTLPETAHLVTWTTQPNPFPVTKTAAGSYSFTGSESAGGEASVCGVSYTVQMSREGDMLTKGNDFLRSVDFTDTMILPSHFYWRESILQAIGQGRCYLTAEEHYENGRIFSVYTFHVEADGITYEPLVLRVTPFAREYISNPALKLDESGEKIVLSWTVHSRDTGREMDACTAIINLGENALLIDTDAVQEEVRQAGGAVEYDLRNEIQAVQHYPYSNDQTRAASCSNIITIGESDYEISKTCSEQGARFGEDAAYTVSLSNSLPLPFSSLSTLSDPLPTDCYIKPDNMETMFRDDPYGSRLTVTITNGTLCTPISHVVTGTDGQTYTVTQQNEGIDTPYNGKSEQGTDTVLASGATLSLGWAEGGGHLLLTAAPSGAAYTIGDGCDYPSIQSALDGIGYVIAANTRYTCTWDLQGETLQCGETKSFLVRSSEKDSFMRLIGDQDWYQIEGGKVLTSLNTASCTTQSQTSKTATAYLRHYRDFTLFKHAYRDGTLITDEIALATGEIITYTNQVTHFGKNRYSALPLADHMAGAQVLLVSVADNPDLANRDLTIREADGVQVYLLNKPGTYRNVKVGTHLADRVEISASAGGLDTMIFWYLTGIKGAVVEEVSYQATFDPQAAGIAASVCTFRLSNEVWLNDHQTHRLYDRAFVNGTVLRMDKRIVTNLDPTDELSLHDPNADEVLDTGTVHEGETVVYRMLLQGIGDGVVSVSGSSLKDKLPASQNEYWSKENVSIAYVPAGGTVTVSDKSSNAWTIEADPEDPHQQYIRWDDGFQVTLDQGTLYLYVKLSFPSGSKWSDYCHQYGDQAIYNTFFVDQLYASVSHLLAVPARALLQKGVLHSGYRGIHSYNYEYIHNRSEDELWYYQNDTAYWGIVTYYVTICNSGDARLYLTDVHDTLPEGFTFFGLFYENDRVPFSSGSYQNTHYWSYANSLAAIDSGDGTSFAYKQVMLDVETSEGNDGRQTLSFSISQYASATPSRMVSCDEDRGLCYLNKGEAIVIAYYCRTNLYQQTKDVAPNVVAMPYYDYNGAGANLDTRTSVRRAAPGNKSGNDGNRYLMTTAQAGQLGWDSPYADTSTPWLASDVTIYRGAILPGIAKQADRSFASPVDTINWTVQMSNSGTEVLRGYTLTDTMMAPYQFCGEVGYDSRYYSNTTYYGSNPTLFRFDERQPGDQTVTIRAWRFWEDSVVTLEVNGDPQPIATLLRTARNTARSLTVYVGLSRDSAQNETLTIFFPADEGQVADIGNDNYVSISLQTANFTGDYTNAAYVNTAYLTPSENQPFDTLAVTRGNYTLLNGKDSVVSDASVNVAYGYATSSIKSVTELDDGLHETENTAKSTDSRNFIVLSDRESTFRYTLTVNNNGGNVESRAMKKLVVIDSLPQVGDHVTFYKSIPRFSEFKVNFADSPAFSLSVNETPVSPDAYQLQFSAATEFALSDWSERDASGWYTMDQIAESSELSLDKMRSFRVFVDDPSGALIPADALISIGFDAKVDGTPRRGLTAWNSFGYRYHLVGMDSELEAAPMKVGVRIANMPTLVKELKDVHGEAYQAAKDVSFRFLICEGEALELPDNWTERDLQTALGTRKFLIAERTVPAGSSASEPLVLEEQKCWKVENGTFSETDEDWIWTVQAKYTIVELPGNEQYAFDAFNRIRPNNYTFRYLPETQTVLSAVNIREVWDIKVLKLRQQDNEALPGAVFGLYSKTAADKMEDAAYETAAADLDKALARELTVSEQTWYLRDIRTTGDDGTILWKGLEGDGYYVLELQAPEHYKLSENPGQIVNKSDSSDHVAVITAINAPTKELIIRKVVEGEGAPNLQFTFVLNMKDADGNPVAGSFCGQTFDNEGNLEFKLKAGDEKRLAEIPDGYQYKVTEKDVPTNFHVMQAEYEGVMEVEVAAIEVEFTNVYGYVTYELPSGGGSGTYPFTVAGVAVLTTALFLMIRGKRKERV